MSIIPVVAFVFPRGKRIPHLHNTTGAKEGGGTFAVGEDGGEAEDVLAHRTVPYRGRPPAGPCFDDQAYRGGDLPRVLVTCRLVGWRVGDLQAGWLPKKRGWEKCRPAPPTPPPRGALWATGTAPGPEARVEAIPPRVALAPGSTGKKSPAAGRREGLGGMG